MNGHKTMDPIEVVNAPWNKELTVSEATYDGDFKMLHVRIKEGKRFTDLELDHVTAAHLGEMIVDWARKNTPEGEE